MAATLYGIVRKCDGTAVTQSQRFRLCYQGQPQYLKWTEDDGAFTLNNVISRRTYEVHINSRNAVACSACEASPPAWQCPNDGLFGSPSNRIEFRRSCRLNGTSCSAALVPTQGHGIVIGHVWHAADSTPARESHTVVFQRVGEGEPYEVTTEEDGIFTLELPCGEYSVLVDLNPVSPSPYAVFGAIAEVDLHTLPE